MSRWTIGAWVVLLATLPLGLRSYYQNPRIGLFTWQPGSRMGINYRTFHYAAERAQDGLAFYDVPPPGTEDWAVYLYSPVTPPTFYPFTLFEWTTGYAILTVLSVLAAAGTTWLLVDYVESLGPELGWFDVVLLFSVFVFSTHAYGTIYFGNINILLAFVFVLGLRALDQNRQILSGIAFAVAALYKVFPAFIGLWFLRRRSWRAVGAALVTGVGGIVLGAALYGLDTTRYYFREVIAGRTETDLFVGGYPVDGTFYVTVQQPVSHLVTAVWPTAPYATILGTSVLIYGAILAYFYWSIETELDRQMAIFVTLVVMVTLTPSLQWYLVLLYPSIVVLLYFWSGGLDRLLFLSGGVLMSVTFRTGDVVASLDNVSDPVYSVAYILAAHGTIPLYGLLLMVVACVWHKYRHGESSPTGDELLDASTEDGRVSGDESCGLGNAHD